MTKRSGWLVLLLCVLTSGLGAQFTKVRPDGPLFYPAGSDAKREPLSSQPVGEAVYEEWLRDVHQWRSERLVRVGYNDAEYRRPDLLWTQRDFIVPQMMVEDRFFYDVETRRYTVDKLLEDLNKRYGGIDGVLLWPVYPNVGIDNRNQFDLTRDLPGGVAGLRALIDEFHRHHVRVFFPMMPWDTGTREEGLPFWDAVARLMSEVGADGVNGDTMQGIPRAYRVASDKTGHPIAFQPEVNMDSDEFLMWDQQSWGYWKYPFEPLVSKSKVLEPRHMVNVCDRWATDRTDNLQSAFFNGTGYVSWENIWGIWNGITPRDGEALRRIAAIYREFPDLLVSQEWRPGVPVQQFGVYASEFPKGDRTLWTIVNRNRYQVSGEMLAVKHSEGATYYDLLAGRKLAAAQWGGKDLLSFPVEGRGYGAVLMTVGERPGVQAFLSRMHAMTDKPLQSYSGTWQVLPQKLIEINKTKPYSETPSGMVAVPAGHYDFSVSGIEIEGENKDGVDVQYPWEDSPRRQHHHAMDIARFYLDKYPVTNARFAEFLQASHFQPKDDHNFLRDWKNGRFPDGWANKPVTWVSLEDARAYASWAGKRLPHEWEWQYAAQGLDGRRYPWGNDASESAVPTPQTGRVLNGPSEVSAHPAGASPFGVMDMIGNIFEWTDEYVDDHTRAAILRGDGYYHPQGAMWYFPHPQRLSEHAKYLLMAPGKDRSGTLGFRCAADE